MRRLVPLALVAVASPATASPSERAAAAIADGTAHESRGELAQAMRSYRRAQAEAFEHGDPDGESAAKDRMVALAWRVPSVTFMVASPPPGFVLEVDGERVAPTAWSHHELDPGHHTVVAWAPSRAPVSTTLELRAAEHASLPIELDLAPVAYAYGDPGRARRRAGLITAGAGAALMAATFAWASHEASLYHAYTADPIDAADARRANDIVARVRYLGTASFALSVGALVTGGVLYFGAPARRREALTVSPSAAGGAYGLALSGGF